MSSVPPATPAMGYRGTPPNPRLHFGCALLSAAARPGGRVPPAASRSQFYGALRALGRRQQGEAEVYKTSARFFRAAPGLIPVSVAVCFSFLGPAGGETWKKQRSVRGGCKRKKSVTKYL